MSHTSCIVTKKAQCKGPKDHISMKSSAAVIPIDNDVAAAGKANQAGVGVVVL
jgi:hypothetical protein